jgi:hypothetical protein
VECKQDEEDEKDEESIGSPGRNDVPAQLPIVRQNASSARVVQCQLRPALFNASFENI